MQLPILTPPAWRLALRSNFTDITRLADFLELNALQRQQLLPRAKFPLNLPLRLANKIAKGTLDDPILRQFVPLNDENILSQGFSSDPVGDSLCQKSSKLLHKYKRRVLLVTTSACAMHCRYCFRQNFEYDVTSKLFDNEIGIIAADASINEVILSGGDPLSLDNKVLEDLINRLTAIPHIKKLRFHSRFPVGIPERIDEGLLDLLKKAPLQVWFVLHVNHPAELDEEVILAVRKLQDLRIPVLNQSVFLKGVNDTTEVMEKLCSKLVDNGIIPYYLHQLDRVDGTAHFEVEEEKGRQMIRELSALLPGYAVPRYVREISGMPGKTAL